MPKTFKCPSCQAPLEHRDRSQLVVQCSYCNNQLIVPETLRPPASSDSESGVNSNQLIEIEQLLKSGQKIEAVKVYRRYFSSGLKEAKEAVEHLERGEGIVLPTTMTNSNDHNAQLMEITELINAGHKLDAIKLYRNYFSVRLKEAKEAVEQLARDEEIVLPAKTNSNNKGCTLSWLILLLLFGAGIYFFYSPNLENPLSELTDITGINTAFTGKNPVLLTFGSEGIGPGLFDDPRFVAVDQAGQIYVGEFRTGRIQRFAADGSFINQWMMPMENANDPPILEDLEVDRDGTVYLVSGGEIWLHDGESGDLLGSVPYSDGSWFDNIALSSNGEIVAAWYRNRDDIVRLNQAGNTSLLITEAISGQTSRSELNTQVAVDGLGNIYALGSFNGAIFVFNSDGRFVTRIGSEGTEEDQFRSPSGIAVDGYGRIYVADFGGIKRFDSAGGRYLDTIPVDGAARDIAFTPEGNMVVATSRNMVIVYTITAP